MWSTDYPHTGTEWPDRRVVIQRLFRGLPRTEVKQMLHGNCRELHRLDHVPIDWPTSEATMDVMSPESPPFAGVRAISIGHTLPGLYAIAILRDLGVEVIRIERLPVEGGENRYGEIAGRFPTESLDAGTARCELDLKDSRGREVFLRMAERADVILEGFRPGTSTRLGIDYPTLAARNPGLIYAAISGFGQDGPWRNRPGHDINYLAGTGVLDVSGGAGGPPVFPGVTVADGIAGMSAALNVLAALHARSRGEKGCYLDVAIIDGPLFLMSMELEHYWATRESRTRGDTHVTGRYPWYQVFETKDGKYLSVGAVEPPFYRKLCELIGRPDLAGRQFADGEELAEQIELFRSIFRSRTRDEWLERLGDQDTCVAPVLSTGEVADAPHARRGIRHVPGAPTPLVRSLARWTASPTSPPASTNQALRGFGFTDAEIDQLRANRVIGR